MGIKGLHGALAPASEEHATLAVLAGRALAVDATAWLHRGACGCAEWLFSREEKEDTTPPYAQFVVERVRALARLGARCVLVFDGPTRAPIKARTEDARRRKREASLAKARAASDKLSLARGGGEDDEDLVEERRRGYVGAINVTPEMVKATIRAVANEQRRVISKQEARKGTTSFVTAQEERETTAFLAARCLVAPYEADPQLAALCLPGQDQECDVIVTEDSDAFAYVASCGLGHVLVATKLDTRAHTCTTFSFGPGPRAAAASSSSGFGTNKKSAKTGGAFFNGLRAFGDFNDGGGRKFVQCAVLAGSDYAENLLGCGISSAATLVKDHRCGDDDKRLGRIVAALRGKHSRKKRVITSRESSSSSSSSDGGGGPSKTSSSNETSLWWDDFLEELTRAEAAFYRSKVFVDAFSHSDTTPECVALFSAAERAGLAPSVPAAPSMTETEEDAYGAPVTFADLNPLLVETRSTSRTALSRRKTMRDFFRPTKPHLLKEEQEADGTTTMPGPAVPAVPVPPRDNEEVAAEETPSPPPHTATTTKRRRFSLEPDEICVDTLDELPDDVRDEIARGIALARRSLRPRSASSSRASTVSSSSSSSSSSSKKQRSKKHKPRGTTSTTREKPCLSGADVSNRQGGGAHFFFGPPPPPPRENTSSE